MKYGKLIFRLPHSSNTAYTITRGPQKSTTVKKNTDATWSHNVPTVNNRQNILQMLLTT